MVMVSRDAFARTELHTALRATSANCSWCGQRRFIRNKPTHKLRVYWTETDGGTKRSHTGQFCSVGCFRSYNGG